MTFSIERNYTRQFDIENQPGTLVFDKFSFKSNSKGLFDLMTIHKAKIKSNLLSGHPLPWIKGQYIGVLGLSPSRYSTFKYTRAFIGAKDLFTRISQNNKQKELSFQRTLNSDYYLTSYNLALEYFHSKPSLENAEICLQSEIEAADENSEIEVHTPVGKIDVLTKNEIIEIKKSSSWKHGMGQLLAYSTFYPDHSKILLLFGISKGLKVPAINDICKFYGINCIYRQINC